MLLMFSFQQMLDTIIWITFASIALETGDLFNVSVTWVNVLSLLVLGLFLPGMVWCSYLMSRCGLRNVVLVGAILHLAAGVMRYVAVVLLRHGAGPASFALLFAGQFVSSFAQPICTNLPVRLANDWFPTEERDVAMTLGNFGLGVGNLFGVGAPSHFVWRAADGSVHGMETLLLLELGLTIVGFIWTWLCFVDEPEYPPSTAAAMLRGTRAEARDSNASRGAALARLLGEYWSLLRDRNFCLLLFAFSIGLGFFNSIFTALEQLVHPAGYGAREAGHIGNIFIFGGVVTSALSGKILDTTHAYKTMLKITYGLTFFTTLGLVVSVRPDQLVVLCAAAALMGATCLPLLPVSLGTAAEVTFPVPEEASTGLMIFAGNTLGVVFTFVYAALIPLAPKYTTVWTPAGIFTIVGIALATTAALLYDGDHKRFEAESSAHLAGYLKVEEDGPISPNSSPRSHLKVRRLQTGLGGAVLATSLEGYFPKLEARGPVGLLRNRTC